MSTIHDALQRAAEADRRRGGPGPRLIPLQEVSSPRSSRPPARGFGWLLLLSVLGGTAWWVWTSTPSAPDPAPEPAFPTTARAPSIGPATGELAAPVPALPEVASRVAADAIQVSTNLVVRHAPPPAEPTVDTEVALAAQAADPGLRVEEQPAWKLQSIILRTVDPLAMINGQTVRVGDEVDGGRVSEIRRDAVVVEWRGNRHRLELAEK